MIWFAISTVSWCILRCTPMHKQSKVQVDQYDTTIYSINSGSSTEHLTNRGHSSWISWHHSSSNYLIALRILRSQHELEIPALDTESLHPPLEENFLSEPMIFLRKKRCKIVGQTSHYPIVSHPAETVRTVIPGIKGARNGLGIGKPNPRESAKRRLSAGSLKYNRSLSQSFSGDPKT